QRRLQNRQIYTAAQEQIARNPSLLDWEALVLSHPAWHAGIIGIVASRLAEQYHRPVVLLSVDEAGHARGSARSAPGYDIGAAIAAQADLLHEYGGHPGAAGLSLHENDIPAFRRRLSDTLHATRDPDTRAGLMIDAENDLAATGLELAHDLRQLAPFGEGNPPITFITRDLTLRSAALIGRTREHRRLTVQDAAGNRRSVLWWNSADQPVPDDLFDLAYQVSISTYKDTQELQLTLIDYRRAESAPVQVERPQRTTIDHRATHDPDTTLADLLTTYPDAAVWAEGYRRTASPGQPLHELTETPTLIVYTAPAAPQRLQKALERTQAHRIALLGINPPIRAFTDVQRRLLELVKFVLNQKAGRTTLDDLTGALAQSLATIRLGLDTIAAHGEIAITYGRGGTLTIVPGDGTTTADAADYSAALRASIAETTAYRAFFHRATPAHILGEQLDA
ncbi:MAG: DHH family phosphoesterase, partial [Anaerolineae bacterium]|nr:DHH family phosphoesterase [Anaerolineae bacterium]